MRLGHGALPGVSRKEERRLWSQAEESAGANRLSLLTACSDTMRAYTSASKGGQKVPATWSTDWPTTLKLTTAATVTPLWCYSRKVTSRS